MTKLSGVLFLVIGLFIFSCSFDNKIEQTGPQNLEELEIPDGFNWDFTKDVNVNITARDANGALVEGVSVSLYKSESNLVFDLPTNEYGNINTDITMQESADFAIVNYQGNSITVPVNGNSIDCDLTVEPVRDIRASGTIYYPAENSVSTVMFEDMWPNKSDYDFNDMVVETWGTLIYTDDYIESIELKAKVIASGASLHNGFSIRYATSALPQTPSGTVTYSAENSSGPIAMTSEEIQNDWGASVSWWDTEYMMVSFFEDAYAVLGSNAGFTGVNTDNSDTWHEPVTITVLMEYDPIYSFDPNSPSFDMFAPNPYITVGIDTGVEIHLPGMDYSPGFSAEALFGTGDDVTPAGGMGTPGYSTLAFTTAEGFSWGLLLEGQLEHPTERTDIILAYPELADYFAETLTSGDNWWQPHPDEDYSEGYIYDRADLTPAQQNGE